LNWVSQFIPRLAWITILLLYTSCATGMTGVNHHAQLLLVEMGSCKLLPRLASNLDPPDLCFLSS
jgi:hypothetical protein